MLFKYSWGGGGATHNHGDYVGLIFLSKVNGQLKFFLVLSFIKRNLWNESWKYIVIFLDAISKLRKSRSSAFLLETR